MLLNWFNCRKKKAYTCTFDFCFRRIRDKYESEISELERSERQINEKYNETKVSRISCSI